MVTTVSVSAASSGVGKVATNKIEGRPLSEGIFTATTVGGLSGLAGATVVNKVAEGASSLAKPFSKTI